jgi:hypothetical protein
MQSNSRSKKKPYPRPAATKVTPEQARQFVANRLNCSDQEAVNLLESLRRELQQNEEVPTPSAKKPRTPANEEKRERSA